MKFLCEVKHPRGAHTTIWLCGESEESTRDAFLFHHPHLSITSMMELPEWNDVEEKRKTRSDKQIRAHNKARLTQVRNNLNSLLESDSSILTSGERVQIARISCKLTRLLSGWGANSINIELWFEDI